jgi:hypothetical protein
MLNEIRIKVYSTHQNDPEMFSQFRSKLQSIFEQQNTIKARQSVDAAYSHRSCLAKFASIWRTVHTNVTCLCCLARSPDNNVLTCEHALCGTCIITNTCTSLTEPWTFPLSHCPLCTLPNDLVFHLKPSTAGVRALCIDGESPNDILVLKALERKLPAPISTFFDLAFGNGSGMN